MMRLLVRLMIRGYQVALSPLLKWLTTGNPNAATCRFHPTCSHYGLEAIERHGVIKGLWLTGKRLLRCHPWGGYGEDPVPPPSSRPSFSPISDDSLSH
jgi:hypothetical protein